jgi:phage shock protein A
MLFVAQPSEIFNLAMIIGRSSLALSVLATAQYAIVRGLAAGSKWLFQGDKASVADKSQAAKDQSASGFLKDLLGYLKRAAEVVLGWFGIVLSKAETPQVLAQRIVDQLNAAKPEYNRKVQQASTLVSKIELQIKDEREKAAKEGRSADALIAKGHDDLAAVHLKNQKSIEASIATNEEQLKLAKQGLEDVKAERTRFYRDREATLAKIQSQLNREQNAAITKQMAELKGGFDITDVSNEMDRLNQLVNDKEAEARGTRDAVESSPEELLRKAEESIVDDEVQAEIARRKAELAKKAQAAKDQSASGFLKDLLGYFKRAAEIVLGWFGIVLSKAETPQVLAQRIVDQLNAAKPEYNRKVQQASTLVSKIELQIKDEREKAAKEGRSADALIAKGHDDLAAVHLKNQKSIEASIATNEEQLKLAKQGLEDVKAERTRFYRDREATLAKIQSQLNREQNAAITKQMAELKGGFDITDVSNEMDRLNQLVNEKEAEARGTRDAVESSPEELLRKAEESIVDDEVQAEIARRKAELARKAQAAKDESAGSLGTWWKSLPLIQKIAPAFILSWTTAVAAAVARMSPALSIGALALGVGFFIAYLTEMRRDLMSTPVEARGARGWTLLLDGMFTLLFPALISSDVSLLSFVFNLTPALSIALGSSAGIAAALWAIPALSRFLWGEAA